MSMHRLLHAGVLLVFVLAALTVPPVISADTESPDEDYNIITTNGTYLFVMLCDAREGYGVDPILRSRYSQSGLYLNDGSATLLWSVDWYAYNVEVSSDGHHLVQPGPWPIKGHFHELAVAFYKDGRQLKRYSVQDLVKDPHTLPTTVSHYGWQKEQSFNDEKHQLSLSTINGEEYLFDITTGLIVSQSAAPADMGQTAAPTSNRPVAVTETAAPTLNRPGRSSTTLLPRNIVPIPTLSSELKEAPKPAGPDALIITLIVLGGMLGLLFVGWLGIRKRRD